jgi:two-component system NtrC family sensor kinase
MRLWIRLAIVTATVAIIPLVIGGYFATDISISTSKAQSELALKKDANIVATLVNTWVEEASGGLSGWMKPYSIDQLSEMGRLVFLESVYIANPSVRSVGLMQGKTMVTKIYEVDAESGYGFSELPESRTISFVERILATPEPSLGLVTWGEPFWPPDGASAPWVPIRVASSDDSGFMLVAEVDLSRLTHALSLSATPEHAVALVSSGGTPIVGAAHALYRPSVVEKMLGLSTTFEHAPEGFLAVSGATTVVPQLGWTVVVLESTVRTHAVAGLIERRTGQILFLATLASLALGSVLGLQLASPVKHLVRSAKQLADGDYTHRTLVSRTDELGDLGVAFNEMASQLQAQVDEISLFNSELQELVEERTNELKMAQAELVSKGQLAAVAEVGAGLAHELNNPLAAILGLAQLIQMQSSESDERLVELQAQAERCRKVVAVMQRVSSGERIDKELLVETDLSELLRDALDSERGVLLERGVALALSVPESPAPVSLNGDLSLRLFAPFVLAICTGAPVGSLLNVSLKVGADYYLINLVIDSNNESVSAAALDQRMAGGVGYWTARRILGQLGGTLSEKGAFSWHIQLRKG